MDSAKVKLNGSENAMKIVNLLAENFSEEEFQNPQLWADILIASAILAAALGIETHSQLASLARIVDHIETHLAYLEEEEF